MSKWLQPVTEGVLKCLEEYATFLTQPPVVAHRCAHLNLNFNRVDCYVQPLCSVTLPCSNMQKARGPVPKVHIAMMRLAVVKVMHIQSFSSTISLEDEAVAGSEWQSRVLLCPWGRGTSQPVFCMCWPHFFHSMICDPEFSVRTFGLKHLLWTGTSRVDGNNTTLDSAGSV